MAANKLTARAAERAIERADLESVGVSHGLGLSLALSSGWRHRGLRSRSSSATSQYRRHDLHLNCAGRYSTGDCHRLLFATGSIVWSYISGVTAYRLSWKATSGKVLQLVEVDEIFSELEAELRLIELGIFFCGTAELARVTTFRNRRTLKLPHYSHIRQISVENCKFDKQEWVGKEWIKCKGDIKCE